MPHLACDPTCQITSASRLLHAAARLSAHFAAGEMPHVEQQQQQQQQQQRIDTPLCTHQYSSAFGTYRKPTHVRSNPQITTN